MTPTRTATLACLAVVATLLGVAVVVQCDVAIAALDPASTVSVTSATSCDDGTLPADTDCRLTALTYLNLHKTLVGVIPDALWKLTKLAYLSLGYTNIGGGSLGNCRYTFQTHAPMKSLHVAKPTHQSKSLHCSS